MINVSELRIGNLFYDVDGTPCYYAGSWQRQDGWISRDSAGNTYKEKEMYPIPLTPEVLEKCGFSHKGGWMGKSFMTEIYDEDVELIFEFMDNDLNVYAYDQRVSTLQNPPLHQLQNLYFALTQTELEYKP